MKLSEYYVEKIFDNQKLLFLTIIIIALIIRIPIIYFFSDIQLQNEWFVLVKNLTNHGEFSFRNFGDFYIPNLFMPPLYAWFLYLFKIFNLNNENYISLILYTQALLSSLSIATFFIISKKIFSKKISLFLSALFCLFPSYLYACGQISSISLYVFLLVLFIYFFIKIVISPNFKFYLCLGITSGLLILLRGEFILLFIFSLFYLFLFYENINLKSILSILLISFLVISPYLYRNITNLNSFSITKSIGFNLWKGNNPKSNVEGDIARIVNEFGPIGFEGELKKKIDDIKIDKYYDINLDSLFLKESLKNIYEEPERYFILYLKKIFSFLLFDINSSYKNYYNPLHLFPLLVISITSLISLMIKPRNSKKLNFIALFYLAYVFIFSLFFILPRYNLIVLPMQIILTGKILNKFIKD